MLLLNILPPPTSSMYSPQIIFLPMLKGKLCKCGLFFFPLRDGVFVNYLEQCPHSCLNICWLTELNSTTSALFYISRCILFHYNTNLHFSNTPHCFRILFCMCCAFHLESLSFSPLPFSPGKLILVFQITHPHCLDITFHSASNFSTSINCIFEFLTVPTFMVTLIVCFKLHL